MTVIEYDPKAKQAQMYRDLAQKIIDNKMLDKMTEIESLFPLSKGVPIQSECPIGLIGDDIEAVAKKKATIVNMTYAVVIFSILVQGAPIGRLFPLKFLERIMGST